MRRRSEDDGPTTLLTPEDSLRPGPGFQLDPDTRGFMETRFGHGFGQVRVHTDPDAARLARIFDAQAYTVGSDIFFGEGRYDTRTRAGRELLVHELTHVVQQGASSPLPAAAGRHDIGDRAEAEAKANSSSQANGLGRLRASPVPVGVYRQGSGPRVSFPAVEELLIQGAELSGAVQGGGRALDGGERKAAEGIFGNSVNLSRVRILVTPVVHAGATFGHQIRVEPEFYRSYWSNRILIHELTHVWQYEHRGSSYISDSALHQAVAIFSGGNRGGAYEYKPTRDRKKSFFDYPAEHQARIVEDFFAGDVEPDWQDYYARLVNQMRSTLPLPEEVRGGYIVPLPGAPGLPPGREEIGPVKSLFRVEF